MLILCIYTKGYYTCYVLFVYILYSSVGPFVTMVYLYGGGALVCFWASRVEDVNEALLLVCGGFCFLPCVFVLAQQRRRDDGDGGGAGWWWRWSFSFSSSSVNNWEQNGTRGWRIGLGGLGRLAYIRFLCSLWTAESGHGSGRRNLQECECLLQFLLVVFCLLFFWIALSPPLPSPLVFRVTVLGQDEGG